MGRATIIDHLGDALYRIAVDRSSPRVAAIAASWRTEANNIDAKVSELSTGLDALQQAATEEKAAYEADQQALGPDLVSTLLSSYLKALAQWEAAQTQVDALLIQAQHLRARADNAELYTAEKIVDAWCATYTTDLEPGREVATMEVARQTDDYPYHVIAPQGRAPVDGDGQVRDVMSMSAAQAFLNYALLPGAVKWRTRFLHGTALAVDSDTQVMTVSLPDVISGSVRSISGVIRDISFLDLCSGVVLPDWLINRGVDISALRAPYRVGDRVMIDADQDVVVGWAEHPRNCDFDYLTAVTVSNGLSYGMYNGDDYEEWESYEYSRPDGTYERHLFAWSSALSGRAGFIGSIVTSIVTLGDGTRVTTNDYINAAVSISPEFYDGGYPDPLYTDDAIAVITGQTVTTDPPTGDTTYSGSVAVTILGVPYLLNEATGAEEDAIVFVEEGSQVWNAIVNALDVDDRSTVLEQGGQIAVYAHHNGLIQPSQPGWTEEISAFVLINK